MEMRNSKSIQYITSVYFKTTAMKKLVYIFSYLIVNLFLFASCETVIDPKLEEVEDIVVVDAWINTKFEKQVIKVMMTQAYFDNSLPPGVSSASVTVQNVTTGNLFTFTESSTKGSYVWTPASLSDQLGNPGDDFRLLIQTGGESYESFSKLGRVPGIDSVSFTFEEANSILPAMYMAEFWAKDPIGLGDTYWIKAFKNDTLLNKPSEISVAFDAGFSNGGNFDGIVFIPPIRQSVNPFDQDEDDNFLSPYEIGDSLYVELHSISLSAFNYLNQVRTQTDRPGGFGELFSSPIANVSTNINNVNANGKKAIGFFNVASVSGNGKRLVK
jgi:hypothetical protein